MDKDELNRIINDSDDYDPAQEYSLMTMLSDFYSKKMLSVVILIWTMGIIFMAGAIYSAVKFFQTDNTQAHIMYAVIFLTLIQWVGLLKIMAWQIIHRNNIRRELKRLELRVAQLNRTAENA